MKKFSNILLTIFAIGVLVTMLAGAFAFVGYVVAMFIGGEAATALCAFIYKSYFPWVIKICSVCVGCGLIGMYLNKMRALTFSSDKDSENK